MQNRGIKENVRKICVFARFLIESWTFLGISRNETVKGIPSHKCTPSLSQRVRGHAYKTLGTNAIYIPMFPSFLVIPD